MTRWWLALVVYLAVGPIAVAGGELEDQIEREIETARRQIDEAASVLAELHRKQYAMGSGKKKAMLGILLDDSSNRDGVELVGVTPGGGAEEAGLQAGDLIVKLNGLSLVEAGSPMRVLVRHMKGVAPGDEVTVDYVRRDKSESTTIITQARGTHVMKIFGKNMENLDLDLDLDLEKLVGMADLRKEIWVHKDDSSRQLLAVSGDLAAYFDVEEGIVLLEPPTGSELKAGDVLLGVAGQEIHDVEAAIMALGELEGRAKVSVKRHGKRKTVNVGADEFADVARHLETHVIRIKHSDDDDEEVVVKIEGAID